MSSSDAPSPLPPGLTTCAAPDRAAQALAALRHYKAWTTAIAILQLVLGVLLAFGWWLEHQLPGVLELISRGRLRPLTLELGSLLTVSLPTFYLALGVPVALCDILLARRERRYALRGDLPSAGLRRLFFTLSRIPGLRLGRNLLVLVITLGWLLILGAFLVGWFLVIALLVLPSRLSDALDRAQGLAADAIDEGLSEATAALRLARQTVLVAPLLGHEDEATLFVSQFTAAPD